MGGRVESEGGVEVLGDELLGGAELLGGDEPLGGAELGGGDGVVTLGLVE